MTQNLQVFRQQTVFYLHIKIFTGLLVVSLKKEISLFWKRNITKILMPILLDLINPTSLINLKIRLNLHIQKI